MVNVLHETSATLCFHRIWTSENRVGHSSCIEKKKLSAANFAGASCIVCFFDVHLRLWKIDLRPQNYPWIPIEWWFVICLVFFFRITACFFELRGELIWFRPKKTTVFFCGPTLEMVGGWVKGRLPFQAAKGGPWLLETDFLWKDYMVVGSFYL